MASICNDERVFLGVMSGHERKTLSLSDAQPRPGPGAPAVGLDLPRARGCGSGRVEINSLIVKRNEMRLRRPDIETQDPGQGDQVFHGGDLESRRPLGAVAGSWRRWRSWRRWQWRRGSASKERRSTKFRVNTNFLFFR